MLSVLTIAVLLFAFWFVAQKVVKERRRPLIVGSYSPLISALAAFAVSEHLGRAASVLGRKCGA